MHAHKTAKGDCAFLHKTHIIHSLPSLSLPFMTLFHRMASQKPIVRHNENVVIIRSAAARFASQLRVKL